MSEFTLQQKWNRLMASLPIESALAQSAFHDLLSAYGEEKRWYHNLEHLDDVLSTIDWIGDEAEHPALVRLAAWFHDAVYDPRANDNEERSALLSETVCMGWGLTAEDIALVGRLIRATKTHEAKDEDCDAAVLLDADLAILGAEEVAYDRYTIAIRQEYAWVPEDDYRRGRTQVLQRFLKRERLFRLGRMRDRYETQARRNLFREIASLQRDDG